MQAEQVTGPIAYHGEAARSWKGYDWDVLDRLFERGCISDPRGKAKSVLLTEEGVAKARYRAAEYFRPPG